jgi:hypothetical protein
MKIREIKTKPGIKVRTRVRSGEMGYNRVD